jgi:hypothetical protein
MGRVKDMEKSILNFKEFIFPVATIEFVAISSAVSTFGGFVVAVVVLSDASEVTVEPAGTAAVDWFVAEEISETSVELIIGVVEAVFLLHPVNSIDITAVMAIIDSRSLDILDINIPPLKTDIQIYFIPLISPGSIVLTSAKSR